MSGHLTRYLLLGISSGEIPVEEALQTILDHLVDQCPECQRVLTLVAESLGLEDLLGQPCISGSRFVTALEKDRQRKEEGARRIIRQLEQAGENAPAVVRGNVSGEYANPVLAQLLISRAWTYCKARKPGGGDLGLAASEVGRHLKEQPNFLELSFSYQLAGLTVAANAARIEDRLEDAFEFLAKAQDLVEDVADPGVLCDYFRVSGSARLDSGSIGEAVVALKLSIELAADARDNIRLIKASLILAELLRTTKQVSAAVRVLEDSLRELEKTGKGSERDFLAFLAQANLAVFWCELNRPLEAKLVIETLDVKQFRRFGQEPRFYWIHGLVARAEGREIEAVGQFIKAMKLFERGGFILEAGLAVLDAAKCALTTNNRPLLSDSIKSLGRLSEQARDPWVASQLYLACLAVQNDTLKLSLLDDLYEKLRRRTR